MQSLLKAMNRDLQGLWIARLARDPLLVSGLLLPVWCVGARTRFLMTRCTIPTFVNVLQETFLFALSISDCTHIIFCCIMKPYIKGEKRSPVSNTYTYVLYCIKCLCKVKAMPGTQSRDRSQGFASRRCRIHLRSPRQDNRIPQALRRDTRRTQCILLRPRVSPGPPLSPPEMLVV